MSSEEQHTDEASSRAELETDPITLLALQRRQDAEAQSLRPRPDFIDSIERTSVSYTFDPSALPYKHVDAIRLNSEIESRYGSQLEADFSPLLSSMDEKDFGLLGQDERLQKLTKTSKSSLQWSGGRFPLRDDFVGINLIFINRERIVVSVSGVSQVAETIAKEIIEIMWSISGSKKTYADVEKLLQLKAFTTQTRLLLGFGPERLLNKSLINFLNAQLASGANYAASMGKIKQNYTFDSSLSAVVSLDDLTIRVAKFDAISGYYEPCEIQFSVTAQSDYNTGRILAITEMPYEEHVELLENLFKELDNQ